MAMSNAELGAHIDQHRMQIADLATQVDILNQLVSNIDIATLKADVIATFARAQARITALESKSVDLDQEIDKMQEKAKDKGWNDKKNALVDNKMVPEVFDNPDKQNFRQWSRKVKKLLQRSHTRIS